MNSAIPRVVADIRVPGRPYRPVATRDGKHVLVSLAAVGGSGRGHVGVIDAYEHRYIHEQLFAGAAGMCVDQTGNRVFIAQKIGAVAVANVDALVRGEPAITGWARTSLNGGTGMVATTDDERYLVTSEEGTHCLAVLDAGQIVGNVERDAVVGIIPTDRAPISVVPSPDGEHLFATGQSAREQPAPGGVTVVATAAFGTRVGWGVPIPGAVVARVEVGNAVRLALSHGGRVAWVTLRAENRVVALDAADLVAGKCTTLASIDTGPAPVGVTPHGDDRYVLVANSNRFDNQKGIPQTVTVIDARDALAGQPAVVDTLAVGVFPRELVAGATGEVYLTNFGSGTVSVIR